MERDLGIEGYLTSSRGVGGVLKASPDDFVVEEVPLPPAPAPDGRYAIATLRVRNWETNRLVRQLARSLRISRRRIGFAGTKDKRALTTQLVSFEGLSPEAVRALAIKDVEVLDAFAGSRPLEIGDLVGNRFRSSRAPAPWRSATSWGTASGSWPGASAAPRRRRPGPSR